MFKCQFLLFLITKEKDNKKYLFCEIGSFQFKKKKTVIIDDHGLISN